MWKVRLQTSSWEDCNQLQPVPANTWIRWPLTDFAPTLATPLATLQDGEHTTTKVLTLDGKIHSLSEEDLATATNTVIPYRLTADQPSLSKMAKEWLTEFKLRCAWKPRNIASHLWAEYRSLRTTLDSLHPLVGRFIRTRFGKQGLFSGIVVAWTPDKSKNDKFPPVCTESCS